VHAFMSLIRKNILFVCTHNSARSQMAEALMRAHHGDRFKASSAGTFATEVHPLARIVMKELGIDLSGHSSTTTEAVSAIIFDVVV